MAIRERLNESIGLRATEANEMRYKVHDLTFQHPDRKIVNFILKGVLDVPPYVLGRIEELLTREDQLPQLMERRQTEGVLNNVS